MAKKKSLPYPQNLTYYLYKDSLDLKEAHISVEFNTLPVTQAVEAMEDEHSKAFINLYFQMHQSITDIADAMNLSTLEVEALRRTTCAQLRDWIYRKKKSVLMVPLANYNLLENKYRLLLAQTDLKNEYPFGLPDDKQHGYPDFCSSEEIGDTGAENPDDNDPPLSEIDMLPVDKIGLPTRIYHMLFRADIKNVHDLKLLIAANELSKVHYIGPKSVEIIKQKVHGLES